MIKSFKDMIIDLMLLDLDNAMELLEQYKEINDLKEQDKEYQAILKYIKNYKR